MNKREKLLKTAGNIMGIRTLDLSNMPTTYEDFLFGTGESDGTQFKGVYTDAFWLSPPYGKPRDIDYDRLEVLEKSVWVRMCVQHIVDAVSNAEWSINPVVKGKEIPDETKQEVKDFFEAKTWKESFKRGLRMAIPDMLQYDAGIFLKAFPVTAYDEKGLLTPKNDKVKPTQLYARDGRSFLKDIDLYGILESYWQYSWINPRGIPIRFSPDEVIYLQQNPQSRNPYGISNLEIVEEIIQYMMDSTLAQSKYWKNGMFIGGQIDLPEVKELSELKRYQAYFEAKLRGANKMNKWLVTGGGATVKSIPFTPQQMQWVDSQKWFAKMVFGVFKVTPSELGFTEDLNRATGIQQMQIFKSGAVLPVLKILEDALNREIIWKHFSPDLMFEFTKELDLDDKTKQADIDLKHIDSGLRSINEIRDRDGLEKWEDEKFDLPKDDGMGGEEEPMDDGFDWNSLFEPEEEESDWNPFSNEDQGDNELEPEGDLDKAAMAEAASGTPGYVPIPEAYDGALKPIKTKKKDRELEDKSKKLFDELADEIQAQVDRYFEET